jgi:chromosome segregation ATPase
MVDKNDIYESYEELNQICIKQEKELTDLKEQRDDFVDLINHLRKESNTLKAEHEKLKGELASETKWAKQYHDELADLQAEHERCKNLLKKSEGWLKKCHEARESTAEKYDNLKGELASETKWAKQYHDELETLKAEHHEVLKLVGECFEWLDKYRDTLSETHYKMYQEKRHKIDDIIKQHLGE